MRWASHVHRCLAKGWYPEYIKLSYNTMIKRKLPNKSGQGTGGNLDTTHTKKMYKYPISSWKDDQLHSL